MTYMGNLKEGDRVRVSFEARVAFGSSFGVDLQIGDGPLFRVAEKDFPSVEFEKIEPPVVTFKPGDRLRAKSGGYDITLADDGYLQHFEGGKVGYYRYSGGERKSFNSRSFDKVDLG